MVEYTLVMKQETAHDCLCAVELLMRLKLGQYREIPFTLLSLADKSFAKKRDRAEPYLKEAFDEMFIDKGPTDWKDDQWYRLYNILQALRYQIHLAEHPDGHGVDSYPPTVTGGQPMPICTYKKVGEKRNGV